MMAKRAARGDTPTEPAAEAKEPETTTAPAPSDPESTEAAEAIIGRERTWEIPAEFEGQQGAVLLVRACEKFGVNPDRMIHRQELASWKFYPSDAIEERPAAVRFVTKGGIRIKFYEDDTIDQEMAPLELVLNWTSQLKR